MEKLREIAEWFQNFGITLYFVGGCVRDEIMGLPIEDIDVCVVGGQRAIEVESYLGLLTTETKTVNVENQLRFDIVKDIYLTKKAEADAVKQAKDKKEFEQKILGLIQEKKEEGLKGKTIEELQAMLGD